MTVVQGRTMLAELTLAECWEHVSRETIGRVAILVDGFPQIYPVNHVVHAGAVLFRTSTGSKLRGLLASPQVCFEVDGAAADHTGWSVMVKGHATELHTGAELAPVQALPLRLWAPGEKDHWIRIQPGTVTGRRIRSTDPRRP